MRNGAGSRIATILIVLASSVAARPAPAVEFNCAKAFLKVDFVICRSAEGMKAIGELQAAWDATYATTAPDRKALLVREQREWIRAYAAECGVPGAGAAPQDPTRQTDVCVVDRIQRRTVELRAVAFRHSGAGRWWSSGGGYRPGASPRCVRGVVANRFVRGLDLPNGPASPPERRPAAVAHPRLGWPARLQRP